MVDIARDEENVVGGGLIHPGRHPWGWLAAGGSVLLATGLALERWATTPVEAGRRLVDLVEQRFSWLTATARAGRSP